MSFLTRTPIAWEHVGYLQRWAAHGGCGAVASFVGVVRPDYHGRRQVQALFYEAYADMAERVIARLIAEAAARWSLQAVKVQHRIGTVEAGQISVAVVVAAQHRAIAYAASRFLVDQIKAEAPIWKKEHYEDSTSQWVACAREVLDAADPVGVAHAHV